MCLETRNVLLVLVELFDCPVVTIGIVQHFVDFFSVESLSSGIMQWLMLLLLVSSSIRVSSWNVALPFALLFTKSSYIFFNSSAETGFVGLSGKLSSKALCQHTKPTNIRMVKI